MQGIGPPVVVRLRRPDLPVLTSWLLAEIMSLPQND